jgi:hypothetical protein
VEKYGRARQATDDNIIRRMLYACWIPKATDTHSEYVILIAFPRQEWLSERTSMLLLYVHCLSCSCVLAMLLLLRDLELSTRVYCNSAGFFQSKNVLSISV